MRSLKLAFAWKREILNIASRRTGYLLVTSDPIFISF